MIMTRSSRTPRQWDAVQAMNSRETDDGATAKGSYMCMILGVLLASVRLGTGQAWEAYVIAIE